MSADKRPLWLRYGLVVVAAPAGAAMLGLLLEPALPGKIIGLVLMLLIILPAWHGGLGPGLLCIALSIGIWACVSPTFLSLMRSGNVAVQLYLVIFVIVGVAISVLCEMLHRARRRIEAGSAAVQKACRALLDFPQFKESARQIYDACKELIGATAGFVAMRNVGSDYHEDQFADTGGLPCTVDRDQQSPVRGMRAEAYRTGKPIYENNFSHSRWANLVPEGHATLENVLFVPLVIRGQTLGLLGLANKPGGFNSRDVRIAETFAELAAIALSNGRMVQSLENSERRFRSVVQTASDAIITADSRGIVAFWNRGAEVLFGYTAAEMTGKPLTIIMPPPQREAHAAGINRAASMGLLAIAGKTIETVALRKDGREFPVELAVTQWQTAEGMFFTGITRDITEHKRAERDRETHAAHLDALIDVSTHMLAQTTIDGLLQRAATGSRELTGGRLAVSAYGFHKGAVRVIAAANPGDAIPTPNEPMFRIEKGGVLLDLIEKQATIRLTDEQLRDHPRWWGLPPGHAPLRGLLGARLVGHDGQPVGMILASDKAGGDFTAEDEILLEQLAVLTSLGLQQIEAKAMAEAASAAKDQFLAVLSHELRTPLTPVLLSASTMEHDPSLPPAIRSEISTIRRNVQMEARLIDDLLDLTRITHGKVDLRTSVIDAAALFQGALEICRSEIQGKGLSIGMDFRASEHHVRGDAGRLQQVSWNLIRNAAKFTPFGGRIELQCHNPRPGVLRLEVVDSGIGIEPQYLSRIFDAFEQGGSRAAHQSGGLGLGLAICKAMVGLHGGSIHAESDGPGKGSRFVVELPTAAAPPQITPAAQSVGAAAAPTPLRILLVEDHADSLRIMARLLAVSGHQVQTANTLQAALAVLETNQFDLLISDLGLPDGSGLDLMRQAKARYALKGVAISGYGTEQDLRQSHEAGFLDHLIKPVDAIALQDAILRAVNSPASPTA